MAELKDQVADELNVRLPGVVRERCEHKIGNCILESVTVECEIDPSDPQTLNAGALIFCFKGCPITSEDVEDILATTIPKICNDFGIDDIEPGRSY